MATKKAIINNLFITDYYNQSRKKGIAGTINRLLKKFNYNYEFRRKVDPFSDMNTLEQRINFYHLLSSVITGRIDGEVVELGCYNGQCAMLFQKILNVHQCAKKVHLFDSFEIKFSSKKEVQKELLDNFKAHNLQLPAIHKGYFEETLHTQLPEKVAFAHIDCGFGGDVTKHRQVMLFCLEALYNRLSTGAICVLMDYHDNTTSDPGIDCNPGVKLACDDFFKDKPEQIVCLYGGEVSHAFFIKV